MSSLVLSGDTSGTVTLSVPAVSGSNTITVPALTGTMVVLTSTQSMVQLNTANGYGSTNTKIRRFTNTVLNQGTDITYTDSATLGGSFTVNTAGVYAMSYNDQFSTTSYLGFSLNTTQPTTNLNSITITDKLAVGYIANANAPFCVVAWTGYLPAGSVVRAHTSGASSGTDTTNCQFTIVKVA